MHLLNINPIIKMITRIRRLKVTVQWPIIISVRVLELYVVFSLFFRQIPSSQVEEIAFKICFRLQRVCKKTLQ